MHTANLRKVGGSIMLAVPPSILEALGLGAGHSVGLKLEGERLVIEARRKPRYTLAELLAEAEPTTHPTEDREWVDAPRQGRELI